MDLIFAVVDLIWFLFVTYTVIHYWADFGNRNDDPDLDA